MPTSAQVYLALDVLSSVDRSTAPTTIRWSESTIEDALRSPGWTGAQNGCGEYGRPPVTDDPVAALKVNAFDKIKAIRLDESLPLSDVDTVIATVPTAPA